MPRLLAFTTIVLAAIAASAGHAASTSLAPCKAAQLSGTFNAIPGSEGAGNIVYALAVKNHSSSACTLSGLPRGRLLNINGTAQQTHVIADGPQNAPLVRVAPGHTAHADARFSPDVPGVGEGAAGKACEPKSYGFRVTAPGGGTFSVKLKPATPVCEHGRLQFKAYRG